MRIEFLWYAGDAFTSDLFRGNVDLSGIECKPFQKKPVSLSFDIRMDAMYEPNE